MFEEMMVFTKLLKKLDKKFDGNFEKTFKETPEKIIEEVGKAYEDLFKRYLSTQQGLVELETKLNNLKQVTNILEAEKAQWVQQKVLQEQIIQQALDTANATSNSYLEENNRLQEEVRNLKKEK